MKGFKKALVLVLLMSIMSHAIFPGFTWANADQPGMNCRISLDAGSIIVMQGLHTELRATALPVDRCSQQFIYASADERVARVDTLGGVGYVWGMTPGQTQITVSSAENRSVVTRIDVMVIRYEGIGQAEIQEIEQGGGPEWVQGPSPWDRPFRVDKEAREGANWIDDKVADYLIPYKNIFNAFKEVLWRDDVPLPVRLLNAVKELGFGLLGAAGTFLDHVLQITVGEDWFAMPYTVMMDQMDYVGQMIQQFLQQYANPTVSIHGEREINKLEGTYTYTASATPAREDYIYIWRIGDREYSGSSVDIDFSNHVSVLSNRAEVLLTLQVKGSADGEVLDSEEAVIRINRVYPIILGEREIRHNLEEGDVVEHSFAAQANISGDYTYDWDFGDGRSWSHSPGVGANSSGTVTYDYDHFDQSTILYLQVRLKSRTNPEEVYGSDLVPINILLDEEDDEFEDREDAIERCNEWYESGSGGAGTTRTNYDISMLPVGASFDMRFNAYGIPDRFIVEYEGAEVYNSGWRGNPNRAASKPDLYPGGVSGPGSGSVMGMFAKNQENHFTVTVIGPESGTAWEYAIRANCIMMEEVERVPEADEAMTLE